MSLNTNNQKTKINLFILFIGTILLSCAASDPSDDEVINIVKEREFGNSPLHFLIEMTIEKKGEAYNLSYLGNKITVHPVIVKYRYLYDGTLRQAFKEDIQFESAMEDLEFQREYLKKGSKVKKRFRKSYIEDIEYVCITKYLFGKNKFNEWDIVDCKDIEKREVKKHKRPESQKFNEHYKDKANELSPGEK